MGRKVSSVGAALSSEAAVGPGPIGWLLRTEWSALAADGSQEAVEVILPCCLCWWQEKTFNKLQCESSCSSPGC